MKERDHNHIVNYESMDELDRVLDAALAKYASVEPRQGLQERILAHVRAEQTRPVDRNWWRWAFASGALVFAVLLLTFGWKSLRPAPPPMTQHPPGVPQRFSHPEEQAANVEDRGPAAPVPRRKSLGHPLPTVTAENPKLEHFPSPKPLSEQEQLLANYVARYPQHAVLIARAQAEVERREHEDEMRETNAPLPPVPEQTQE